MPVETNINDQTQTQDVLYQLPDFLILAEASETIVVNVKHKLKFNY